VAQTPGEITAYAGIYSSTGGGYSGDGGPALSAELNQPSGIALDKSGDLYISDTSNNCVRKVSASTGSINVVAGQCGYFTDQYSGNGGLATKAELNEPKDIALDSAGNLYIADFANQVIRKVESATGIITTVAGNGVTGFSGDGGLATGAELDEPTFIALDLSGDLYISDGFHHVIRKVTLSTGIITTVVGTGTKGYTGDGGPAIDARLFSPFGLALDKAGDLYFSDQYGSAVRKVTASTGIISTVAGTGVTGYSGDGGRATSATLASVSDLAADGAGNLYIVDSANSRIRKVNAATGIITTVAGSGARGFSGNGGPAVSAELDYPYGIALDPADNFYISDSSNNQVRKVVAGGLMQSTTSIILPFINAPADQAIELKATVTGPLNSAQPTGSVTFYDAAIVEGQTQPAMQLGTAPLNSSGEAVLSASLSPGEYLLWASYGGNQVYARSLSIQLALGAATQLAPAPYFGPASGTYTHNLQVAIYDSNPHWTIIYTTDGTDPSPTNGFQYEGAIPVTANTTIKAIATALNYFPPPVADSPVSTASFVINLPYEAPLPRGEWAWEDGPDGTGPGCPMLPGSSGTYGTLGAPAANNMPGSRVPAARWTDLNGNLWLFGGLAVTAPDTCPVANDLWIFNTSTREWTWMSGSSTYPSQSRPGMYGALGKFAAGNVPGSRENSAYWTDKSGKFWLFGGDGYDSTGAYGYLNDLWEFNPTTRQWAWMAGSKVVNQKGSYGTLRAPGSANTPGARWSAVGWTDLHDNLWLFGGFAYDSSGSQGDINDLWEFSLATHQWTWMGGSNLVNQYGVYGTHDVPSASNIPGARYGAMVWVDDLGKFWLFGGGGLGAPNNPGMWLNDLWQFNPSDLNWTWAVGSADGGTYPSIYPSGQAGVYDKLGVPDPGNTPGSRVNASTWTDAQGNLWMFGGLGYDSTGNETALNDLWEFDRTKWLWAWMGGSDYAENSLATVYGPYRAPSPETMPGPRSGAASWVDKNGNLWLFGGSAGGDTYGLLNDLFEYQLPK
jgi:N-acetylneuraminic acid mutarotase